MNFCVIGSGAFGIHISYELLSKGHTVTMITDNLKSVSSMYARGISFKSLNYSWLSNVYFQMTNNNYLWLIIFMISMALNRKKYINFKKKSIVESYKIIESYGLDYETCNNNKYFIDFPNIHEKLISKMKGKNNFTLIIKKVTNNDIQSLSKKYDYLFDCRGSNNKLNYLCENIGGYKVTIEADNKETCFSLEDGWFIHTAISNPKLFIAKGGCIVGSKRYEEPLSKSEEIKCISKSIKKKPFWKKYNCKNIIEIRTGARMYSIDMLPFYCKNKNIISIMGGSSVGCTLAPYTSKCMVSEIIYNKKISPFDFSEKRAKKSYTMAVTCIIIFIIFIGVLIFIICN